MAAESPAAGDPDNSKAQVSDIVFTPAVKAVQERLGSRQAYARMEEGPGGWEDKVTPELAAFIAERDSFYMASVNGEGQPYIQHRGGPLGFLKVLDDKTLAMADFRGNRQYISLGNLTENDKVALFLMDYPNRRRVKIWGRAHFVEDDPALVERLATPGYRAKPERALLIHVDAWDANCPQHITPRFTEPQIVQATDGLRRRIVELETEVAALRQRLGEDADGESVIES